MKSAGKVMATVFWDSRRIIFVDYPEKGRTVTGEYYASLLKQLKVIVNGKRPHLARERILLYQDKAHV